MLKEHVLKHVEAHFDLLRLFSCKMQPKKLSQRKSLFLTHRVAQHSGPPTMTLILDLRLDSVREKTGTKTVKKRTAPGSPKQNSWVMRHVPHPIVWDTYKAGSRKMQKTLYQSKSWKELESLKFKKNQQVLHEIWSVMLEQANHDKSMQVGGFLMPFSGAYFRICTTAWQFKQKHVHENTPVKQIIHISPKTFILPQSSTKPKGRIRSPIGLELLLSKLKPPL